MQKQMQVGLGDAIRRSNFLHSKKNRGVLLPGEGEELELLMDALNNVKIDLGFDCDEDGIPDTIEVFAKTAKTSCCRLIDLDELQPKKKTRSRKSKSR